MSPRLNVLVPGLALALLGGLSAMPACAQDRAVIDPTTILGNRELPKVLYIVPWKKPVPGDLSGRPLVSVVDEALAPLDRDVFRRQVSYGDQVLAQARAEAARVAAASPTAAATQPTPPDTAAPALPAAATPRPPAAPP